MKKSITLIAVAAFHAAIFQIRLFPKSIKADIDIMKLGAEAYISLFEGNTPFEAWSWLCEQVGEYHNGVFAPMVWKDKNLKVCAQAIETLLRGKGLSVKES